jgi:hypothetical protein
VPTEHQPPADKAVLKAEDRVITVWMLHGVGDMVDVSQHVVSEKHLV